MRRTSSPTDRKLVHAQALNQKEEKLLSHKITGFSKTEKQLQRELQQIRRTRLSFQQGLKNLNILDSSKVSLDSNRYARHMHSYPTTRVSPVEEVKEGSARRVRRSERRTSTGNLLEVPKQDITKLAGAVIFPDIHPKECSVLSERSKASKIELVKLDDHVTNSDAGGQDRRILSHFSLERQPWSPRNTEVDSDGLKEELTRRCSEHFVAPSYRPSRHRRQSLPVLSPTACEESERESSKEGNESENEKENEIESDLEIEEERKTRLVKIAPSITLDLIEKAIRSGTCAVPSKESNTIGPRGSKELNDQNEAIRPGTCAVPSKESNTIGPRGSKELNDQNEAIRPGTCAVPSKESNTIGPRGSKELNDQNDAIRPGTCAVPSKEFNPNARGRSQELNGQEEGTMPLDVIGRWRSQDFVDQDDAVGPNTRAVPLKESNLPKRRLSSDLNAIDQKQWLYARRGRRASAPVIMTQFQTPQGFTQPQAPSLTPLRKTNQELLIDECLKGKFRAIGHAVVGNVLLRSRRNSENALTKRI